MVEPVDPAQGGELEVLGGAPRSRRPTITNSAETPQRGAGFVVGAGVVGAGVVAGAPVVGGVVVGEFPS